MTCQPRQRSHTVSVESAVPAPPPATRRCRTTHIRSRRPRDLRGNRETGAVRRHTLTYRRRRLLNQHPTNAIISYNYLRALTRWVVDCQFFLLQKYNDDVTVRLCFVLVFIVGQLLALYFSLVVLFHSHISCSGALLLSLVFEIEIEYMVWYMIYDRRQCSHDKLETTEWIFYRSDLPLHPAGGSAQSLVIGSRSALTACSQSAALDPSMSATRTIESNSKWRYSHPMYTY